MVNGVSVARPVAGATVGNAGETSQEVLKRSRGNELFIAVVGPVGAGAGRAAKIIKQFLEKPGRRATRSMS